MLGTEESDRLFVVHALDPQVRVGLGPRLAESARVDWLTVTGLVSDVVSCARTIRIQQLCVTRLSAIS